ncbi:hypothetical protein ACFSQQ_31195 [Mesorhizobium kowhaii]|uniref:hypothetical protein n=1 Tax=Mesorhizobium kowhaii TaxID=1300272 RepID=UPI0035EC89E5
MHGDDRGGHQDGEQENRDAGGLAVEEKIRQRDQHHGNTETGAIARRGREECCHDLALLVASGRAVGGHLRAKGMRIATGFARGGSISHQPSLRNR